MSKSAYPTTDDVQTRWKSLGVINPDKYDEAFALMLPVEKAAGAAREWERRTGWLPFLAGADANEARYFDPPGPHRGATRGGGTRLWLNAGLVTLTALVTGYSATSAGNAQTENEDFWLLDMTGDYNWQANGLPASLIAFGSCLTGGPRSVKITGKWGFGATLSEDVWLAILDYSFALTYQELAGNISRGLYSYQDLNTEVRYGGGGTTPLAAEVARSQRNFDNKVRQYQRVAM